MLRCVLLVLLAGACGRLGFKNDASTSDGTVVQSDASCTWSNFSQPERITELDDPANQGAPTLSPDGQTLAYDSDSGGDLDVYVVPRQGSIWGTPARANFDTGSLEGDPTWNALGTHLYFSSDQINSAVLLYVADITGTTIGTPNLVTGLETTTVDSSTISPNELELLFVDASTNSRIQRATRVATFASWDAAMPVAELASTATYGDKGPSLTSDGLILYFASDRSGKWQIYSTTRPALDQPFGAVTQVVESTDAVADQIDPSLSFDGTTMVFASNRLGGDGGYDIYSMSRTCD